MKQQLAAERAAKERRRSSIRSDNARRSRIHAGARRGDTAEEQKHLQKQLAFGASKSGKLSSLELLNTTLNVPTRTHNFMTTNINKYISITHARTPCTFTAPDDNATHVHTSTHFELEGNG